MMFDIDLYEIGYSYDSFSVLIHRPIKKIFIVRECYFHTCI